MKELLYKLFHLGLPKISSYDSGKRLVFFNKIMTF